MTVDAIVIGSGPNGLVAANQLTDAGWDVVVLEAQPEPGGAVRTAEFTAPGYRSDMFSAFYPLSAASKVIGGLHLEDHGLRWLRAPAALATPTPDGRCAVIGGSVEETAESLDAYAAGDGDGWRRLMEPWHRVGEEFLDALLQPFPPVRPALRLVRRAGGRGTVDLARMALLTARRMGEELFAGQGGRLLVASNALHSDLGPEAAAGGLFGWLLCALAQVVGFPEPEGGAGGLTDALVRRLTAGGGQLRCSAPVAAITVAGGRATGVRLASGETVEARRAVLADVAAPALYRSLLGPGVVPRRLLDDLERFQWDMATVKVDWALSAPVPWAAEGARRACTVHVADSVDSLTRWSADLACSTVPAQPFLLVGQHAMTDPTRMPPGCETAWAYTHVPRDIRADALGRITGRWDDADTSAMLERIEDRIESRAPGFRDLVVGRHVMTPPGLQGNDGNLDWGAINGGTAALHQQLVFRPVPGLARPETFLDGLYLASAGMHPGGGVHGSCGANAASAALAAAPVRFAWRHAQERVRRGRPLGP
ncbi:MAG TPA: NAD(P)/FAD-dependent oxidoreductase [Acidimicrobiales bacterium]|nr:NAD(P)/FAD-dependent oxidoreductase [Acidimicrobiales bacterium]